MKKVWITKDRGCYIYSIDNNIETYIVNPKQIYIQKEDNLFIHLKI